MPTNTRTAPLPTDLETVALIDAKTACKAAGISISTFHQLVADGKAPRGLRWGARCTRWRITDIKSWIERRIKEAESDAAIHAYTKTRAKKASAAARALRAAKAGAQ